MFVHSKILAPYNLSFLFRDDSFMKNIRRLRLSPVSRNGRNVSTYHRRRRRRAWGCRLQRTVQQSSLVPRRTRPVSQSCGAELQYNSIYQYANTLADPVPHCDTLAAPEKLITRDWYWWRIAGPASADIAMALNWNLKSISSRGTRVHIYRYIYVYDSQKWEQRCTVNGKGTHRRRRSRQFVRRM